MQFAPVLVYGLGALSGLLLGLAYARDAASWRHVLRSGAPLVRPAIVDQIFFMMSFLAAGSVALFATVLHVQTFGIRPLTIPLAAASAIMLFYALWFMLRRYYARPVIKIFGIDPREFEDGAALLQAGDRNRVRAEAWMFSGATLHGLGDWRAEQGAADRISAEVAANLAARTSVVIDPSVSHVHGLYAALAGLIAPLGLMAVMLWVLFTKH